MLTLGLIPARGGSKGIPRKNLRLVRGAPLVTYPIAAARASRTLSMVAVSTEDPEIADIARKAGATVIDRPAELAADETPTLPVVQHAIWMVERDGARVDHVVVLQATTPLTSAADIDGAVTKLARGDADSVVSVCEVTHLHPYKLKRVVDDRLLPYLEDEREGIRRQDLPPVYIRNGGIYACRRDVAVVRGSLYGDLCRPYLMPPERSVNVDTEMDLKLLEVMLHAGDS